VYTCERCNKIIKLDDEYEVITTHYFHTECYVEGLVGAIVSAPDKKWVELRKKTKNFTKTKAE
jgi:hypothetical protein